MRPVVSCLPALILLAGCAGNTALSSGGASASAAPALGVSAAVRDAAGRSLGVLTVAETGNGLSVSGVLRGIAPGPHGIHLHAVGLCAAPFASAGGHWNPGGHQHGFDNPQGSHAGDMQNIIAGADSSADVRIATRGGTLRGANGLLDTDGAAIVVHAGPDDYKTDPAGNSGARLACGAVTAP